MKTNIDNHGDPLAPDDPEYQRRMQQAASFYAAMEIEAWQMACAEGHIATAAIDHSPARQGEGA
jgi:hypothetical protein